MACFGISPDSVRYSAVKYKNLPIQKTFVLQCMVLNSFIDSGDPSLAEFLLVEPIIIFINDSINKKQNYIWRFWDFSISNRGFYIENVNYN